MSGQPFSLAIGDVDKLGPSGYPRLMPRNYMHYCPPGMGGWGIVRVGLLVPESVMLFVSPAACGRHGAIAGFQLGFKKRLFFFHISENDMVTGQHLEKVIQAAGEIINTIKPRPRALIICATCVDDLLGSDYDAIALRVEAEHKIPVRICHMDPITREGKTAPEFSVQQAVYSFLPVSKERERSVNIIGNFAPIDQDSEFHELLLSVGFEKIRHIAACSSLEEFYQMGRSSYNILLKHPGHLAARDLQRGHGIPFCFAPPAYSIDTITAVYEQLGEFLGHKLPLESYREEALEELKQYRLSLGRICIAVGESINASPFELARALAEYGFNVPYIFADNILPFDKEHIRWLQYKRPETRVFPNMHPTMVGFLENSPEVDLAIGLDAGYYCSGARVVPHSLDVQPYGYRGVLNLMRAMVQTLSRPRDHREQVYASSIVI
jgi:nitrogenase molybdenum-cofactor synthesis protein NifE